MWCVSVGLYRQITRNRPTTHATLQRNICLEVLQQKCMVIFINLQTTYASLLSVLSQFLQYSWTYLRWVVWNWTDDSRREKLVTWQSQQTTRHTRMAYVGTAAEVVSACYLNMLLAVKTAWLGYGRIEHCAVSRKQHSVGWYNVADTGSFTRLSCVSACVSFHWWNFPTALLCLL